jgi:hypothetical protein
MISVTLIGPDKVRSIVQISEETTVRDVATSRYHLFRRTTKRNGAVVAPFTTEVMDGDTVSVEND